VITFRTLTEIPEDRRVVLTLPPETPIGEAELLVTVAPQRRPADPRRGGLRRQLGGARTGDPRSADNERIDADLSRAYGESQHEAS
jgi:hypothetical protein